MQGLTLVLNAAEGRLQIVLADGSEILCAQDWAAPRRGTELLAPALERIFFGLRLRFSDLERIACVRGPGSFTGIRLVLSTAAALARACGALLAGLDYMQALALGVCVLRGEQHGASQRIWIMTHARRDMAHAQVFASEQDAALPLAVSELELLRPEQCLQRMREQVQGGMRLWATGSALARHAEFAGLSGLACCVPARFWKASPEDLLLLARHAEYGHRDIEALYARPCDAVENLDSIASRRGEDPAQARARLAAHLAAPPGTPGSVAH
ncbi:MAG: tRNA (adenosine(37)-N6)-threonylcarbamoyltransferase complex dimerization subunit type 1 TsaB [Deltaproteobacteria bacterium]|jgi:tRNA threonylcarbamoyl adenosine modification protein YeaZ|nr:tRNA (adenosine(37)-N6)-threonylcarbamoyltransferase complex dimerization subunit type 1 TsaB [Deltaproteobacteria bacterium]